MSTGSSNAKQELADDLTLVTEQNGVRKITLNNPKKRNALSLAMLESLSKNLIDSENLRCIVINANGPAFSGGHDLKELTSVTGSEYHKKVFNFCSHVMLRIRELPLPVIAQVDGIAAAAGCQLAAACDIVVATDNSTFSTPGASVGLFCSTPGVAVARAANTKTAAYMLLTGRPITAQEALRAGLISRLVSKDKLEEETAQITESICSKSKSVIALGKQFFYHQLDLDVGDAYSEGSGVMTDNLTLMDAQEGIESFIGKRKPSWTHSWQIKE
jgi:enoyl-CoA hydratase/carnithine racemase